MNEFLISLDRKFSTNKNLCFFAVSILCAIFTCFYFVNPPAVSLFEVDSYSYIGYHAMRTVGYPLFLSLIKTLMGGYETIPYFQSIIFALSLGFLSLNLTVITKSLSSGLIFLFTLFCLYYLIRFNFEVLPESLYLSVLFILAAFFIKFVKEQTRSSFIFISLCLGLLILIRPSGYFILIATMPLILLSHWDFFKRNILLFLAPLSLCLIAGASVNYYNHGFFSTQSFLGHNLYGKIAFVLNEGMKSEDPLEQAMLDKMIHAMKPIQDPIEKADSLQIYCLLMMPAYDKLRYELLRRFEEVLPETKAIKDKDAFYKSIAIKVIKQNPAKYAEDVALNYAGLWLLVDLKTDAVQNKLLDYIEQYVQIKEFQEIKLDYSYITKKTIIIKKTIPLFMVYVVKIFLGFCFLISFYFIFMVARFLIHQQKVPLLLLMGAFYALNIHGSYLLTAALQAGIVRYAAVMWPYLILMSIIFLNIVINKIYGKQQ